MRLLLNIVISFVLLLFSIVNVFAVGDGNLDGGGGNMGGGSAGNSWSPGNDGVRVTVVRTSDGATVTTPIDLTNNTPPKNIYHFGKVSKTHYIKGARLVPRLNGYASYQLAQPMPRIVPTQAGGNNIDAIKKYFCSEYVIKRIAELTGMNYDILIGGEYKLLLEPLTYYQFSGVMIVTTATEAAMYDQIVGGLLRSRMGTLTHKNLPLAMFLETADLGYPAWGGSSSAFVDSHTIKSSLGLGIVRFTDIAESNVATYDYEYRVDTDVISSVYVSGGQSDPDTPTTVTFNISGTAYTVSNVYYPEGDSQIVWVKWHTPPTEQDVVINVSVSGPGSTKKAVINCKIVDLDLNPPPNPVADDRNDNFSAVAVPSRPTQSSTSWSVWRPWWQSKWEWEPKLETVTTTVTLPALWRNPNAPSQTSAIYVRGWTFEPATTTTVTETVDNGRWVDNGWWEFSLNSYSASMSANMDIRTDSKNPTAYGDIMKSGYGINQTVTATSSGGSAVTPPQNAVSYFPEFDYSGYWRLLERNGNSFEFKQNEYSTYNGKTHFTPIWYPDGAYTVNTWVIDSWTPTGMLSANLTDSLTISGSLWADWHIGPKSND